MRMSILNNILKCSMLFFSQVMFSQSIAKAKLTIEDYGKWSTLIQENLSPNGKWITYKLRYDSGIDTLFVRHIATSKQYYFPKGNNVAFSNDDQWLTVNQENIVLLQNLVTGEQKVIDSAIKADFIMEGKQLVVLIKNSETQDLLVLDLANDNNFKIQNIKEYVISPDKKSVAYINQNNTVQLFWVDRKYRSKTLAEATTNIRRNLVWNDTGDIVTFLEEMQIRDSLDTNHKIYFFKNVRGNDKMYYLNPIEYNSVAEGKTILYHPSFTPLLISPDNKKVFFYINGNIQNSEVKRGVEVWNSNDRLEYQREVLEGNPESRPKLVVWYPELNKIFEISNNQHPSVYLTPDRNKAIVFDPHQYEPQDEITSLSDLWFTDLNTRDSLLIIDKQSRKIGHIGVSPNSRYLNYYKDKKWWVYDIELKKHTLITVKFNEIDNTIRDSGDKQSFYGFAGWSADSKYLIVYTRYDVWLISVDGKKQERLTNGEPDRIRYRVCTNLTPNQQIFKFYDIIGSSFDLKDGLVLDAFNVLSKESGYYKWSWKDKLSKIIFRNAKLNRIKKALNIDAYILIEQKADVSPQIIFLNNSGNEKVLVKTNIHQDKFEWTKSELISYKNSDGINLQGVLHYPSGYQPGNKYPMIVYIYEDQSHLLHNYYNPSLYSPEGFSPANYTTDGYFVLYPDIVYEIGRPGYSAVDCVEAAVKEVINNGMIDEKSIGLIGHSFGGYETSFIVTQSNVFAAAVAGAASTDMVAHSLTLDAGTGRSQMWRFQTHQMRMGKSLYEDYIGFVENSPITYTHKVNTALLSWTGKNDDTVDPQQSIALHMAMRSLKKHHVLLIYPDEGHTLLQLDFQRDLTIKIKAWFDFYLKNVPFLNNIGFK
jgi:dipeptidyl aminopeptidase/acylaminoacyl peptidase